MNIPINNYLADAKFEEVCPRPHNNRLYTMVLTTYYSYNPRGAKIFSSLCRHIQCHKDYHRAPAGSRYVTRKTDKSHTQTHMQKHSAYLSHFT